MAHLSEADVPMLESVNISEIREPIGDTTNGFGWNSLGFLRGAEIHSFHTKGSRFTVVELPLYRDRLTDLSITEERSGGGTLPSDMALELFARCPQLRTCSVHVYDRAGVSGTVEEPALQLSFLHTLDLRCGGVFSCAVRQLFGGLSFPQLKHLKLRGNTNSLYGSQTIYYPPLLHASPLLETLDINIDMFSKTSLNNFLHELSPSLRKIQLCDFRPQVEGPSVFDDEILESLIHTDPSPCCSGLEILEIHDPRCCSFSDETLMRFIKARMLKRVVGRFNREIQLDIRQDLQVLVESGLHLELVYLPHAAPVHFPPWEGLSDTPMPFFRAA
ncbi:hypothetical protein B0H17DRAFT_1134909 [Mycena rosella]|uniref:FBD domain-containing protein n=1 Tax=Mycena rosella TaxID=1033263 RepID=A0AAD7DE55_MYCRO|nr:hypothetical protein B0H17DRAFT_1134909 [Mycena rosella]